MKQASKKQIDFANAIYRQVGVELPKEKTAYAYYHYIKNNVSAYREAINSYEVDDPWSPYAVYDFGDFC